jgi:membrane-bound serine protease (ClpP class)
VVASGATLGGLTLLAASRALAARHAPPAVGETQLLGAIGAVRVPLDPAGQVYVQGALWRARSADPDEPIAHGEPVEVTAVDGLTLLVRRATRHGASTHQGSQS